MSSPPWLVQYVENLYGDLSVIGKTNMFTTDVIKVKSGVFQGDTLSPTLFSLVFNQVLKYLNSEKKHGLSLKNQDVISLAFADDLTLTCKDARSAQRILNNVEEKLSKINLVIKSSKCFTYSLKSGCFDKTRKFKVRGTPVDNIDDKPMKFLGQNIFQTPILKRCYTSRLQTRHFAPKR